MLIKGINEITYCKENKIQLIETSRGKAYIYIYTHYMLLLFVPLGLC